MSKVKLSVRNSVFACAVAIALMGAAPAFAQSIDLPSQALSKTLSQLSVEAKVNIIAPESLIAGKQAPAISGDLSVHDVLTRVLQGTGLQIEQRDSKTYLITGPKPSGSDSKTEATLPTITVSDSATSDNGFVSDQSTTALRTNTPVSETPQSIQIINSEQMQSHQTQSVAEALGMAGGVTVQNTGTDLTPKVYIRGYQASTMSNGNVDVGFSNSLTVPIAGIQQIEVLKGADSILSGKMAPGGVVNVESKQPTATPVREVTGQVGSYGDWLGSLDLGGALSKDDRLTYRFVLSGEHAGETFGGYNGKKDLYIAPSIGWKSGDTSVVLAYQHHFEDVPPTPMALIYNGEIIATNGRQTPEGNMTIQSDTLSVDFKQKFAHIFEFENKSQYQSFTGSYNHLFVPLDMFGPGEAEYLAHNGWQRSYGFDTDNHVRATFSLGPVKQTILAGVDYNEYWSSQQQTQPFIIGPFPSSSLVVPPMPAAYLDSGKSYSNNVYLQDQLGWGRLHLLLSIAHGAQWSATNNSSQAAWSPNFGALYQLTDSVTAYANYFRSFTPQFGQTLLDGSPAPAQTGRTVEAGFKFSFLDDRLTMTADVYRAAIINATQYIPGTANSYELVGGQVTRGFEWSATGHVMPGLNIVANYTYADEPVTPTGTSIVPRHVGNLWATYDLQGETLHGWGIGIGVQARTHYTMVGTGMSIPGQVQTDASVYYKAKKWNASFGVKNIFDNTLYQNQAYGTTLLGVETGRVMYLTGIYNF
jgi:iron complex outermembrane receptor protein